MIRAGAQYCASALLALTGDKLMIVARQNSRNFTVSYQYEWQNFVKYTADHGILRTINITLMETLGLPGFNNGQVVMVDSTVIEDAVLAAESFDKTRLQTFKINSIKYIGGSSELLDTNMVDYDARHPFMGME